MFHDAFKPMPAAEMTAFLERAAKLVDGQPFGAAPCVLKRPLAFYKGHTLIEVLSQDTHPAFMRAFIQSNKGELSVLDWTNEPVYRLNQSAPIVLNDTTVLAYVKFFFTYIKGRHGRFIIIDNPDEIEWKDEPPPAGRRALAKMIEPLAVTDRAADGTFHLSASMIFKDSLFAAKVHVSPDGQVVLTDEEMVVEDIPVRDDTIGL